jgi:hypothetical protein
MAKYEHIILKGVPFLIDESRTIYTYEISGMEPIAIGTLPGGDITKFTLFPDWETRTKERIDKWRTDILPTERASLREAYKPPKQSRARKARKPAASTS